MCSYVQLMQKFDYSSKKFKKLGYKIRNLRIN